MRQYAAADRFFSSALFHRDSAVIRDVYLARVLYELATVRGLTGRHGDAIRLITRAIDVLEALPEVDSAELAIASQGLGSAYLGVRACESDSGRPTGPRRFRHRREPTNPDQVREAAESLSQRISNWHKRDADWPPITWQAA